MLLNMRTSQATGRFRAPESTLLFWGRRVLDHDLQLCRTTINFMEITDAGLGLLELSTRPPYLRMSRGGADTRKIPLLACSSI